MIPGDEKSTGTQSLLKNVANWLRQAKIVSSGFEGQRYLAKWLFLSVSIGIVAGLGAVVFFKSIEWSTEFFLGWIVGYMPPNPVGEGEATVMDMARPWLLPVITALGGLISGIIVFKLAPEAEGHGTDAAIESIRERGGTPIVHHTFF